MDVFVQSFIVSHALEFDRAQFDVAVRKRRDKGHMIPARRSMCFK